MLSPAQNRAIVGILRGGNYEQASQISGISTRSIRRYMQDAEFRRALEAGQAEHLREQVRILQADMPDNIRVMRHIRDDESMPPGLRLRAASVIDASLRSWRDAVDIEARLEAVEERIFYGKR